MTEEERRKLAEEKAKQEAAALAEAQFAPPKIEGQATAASSELVEGQASGAAYGAGGDPNAAVGNRARQRALEGQSDDEKKLNALYEKKKAEQESAEMDKRRTRTGAATEETEGGVEGTRSGDVGRRSIVVRDELQPKGKGGLGPEESETKLKGRELSEEFELYDAERRMQLNNQLQGIMDKVNADPDYSPETKRTLEMINRVAGPEVAVDLAERNLPEVKAEINQLRADIDSLMAQEIDPLQMFDDGVGIAAAIGYASGALTSTLLGPGAPNVAKSVIESRLQRDFEAQRLNLANKQKGTELRDRLVGRLRQNLDDEKNMIDWLQGIGRAAVQQEMAKHFGGADPETQVKIGRLMSDNLEKMRETQQRAYSGATELKLKKRFRQDTEDWNRRLSAQANVLGMEGPKAPEPKSTPARGVDRRAVAGKGVSAPSVGTGKGTAKQSLEQRKVQSVKDAFTLTLPSGAKKHLVDINVDDRNAMEALNAFHFDHQSRDPKVRAAALGKVDAQGNTPVDQFLNEYMSFADRSSNAIAIIDEYNGLLSDMGAIVNMKRKGGAANLIKAREDRTLERLEKVRVLVDQAISSGTLSGQEGVQLARLSDNDLKMFKRVLGGPIPVSDLDEAWAEVITKPQINAWANATTNFINNQQKSLISKAGNFGLKFKRLVKPRKVKRLAETTVSGS